ncbi:MAG: DUF1684 domain-containing protein [Acidobacteriota bacterium]|nr:DUF1684 domain-containing protein [Blastocatellia bacterium]MDW8240748.1 DUF1684 domain-containing protein [Acidobacteriota bacterium]
MLLLVLWCVLVWGIAASPRPAQDEAAYAAEVEQWHQQRIKSLTGETGWLNLAGLFWLKEGRSSFGAAKTNTIVFPSGKAPARIGWFILKDGVVSVRIRPGIDVRCQGKPVRFMTLRSDADGQPTILTHGSLSWFVIKRDKEFAIRLRDSQHPHLRAFKGIERFPINISWRIEAKFEPYDPPRKIPILTVLGTTTKEPSPGALVFQLQGRTHRLDVIARPEDEQLFVMFADETNGQETYGAGRYLYVDRPDKDGTVILDFNKAHNPPCAFTPYATCPLPPEQNRLPLKVTAGEKQYEGPAH